MASRTTGIRQSVSIPASLAKEVRRAERGVQAGHDEKEHLNSAYREFLKEQDPSKKDEAGRNLIRAVLGKGAIAEDQIL